ncbi:alpha-L-fucosidase [soil metagenome]
MGTLCENRPMILLPLLAIAMQTDLPKPTPAQLEWQDAEIGMFLHFAPNTWQDREGDDLSTPLSEIDPEKLDTDQWARTAKSMGAKILVFVAKHVGGFCWWQTDTTDYGVKETPWRGGKGDVMADLSKSCQKYGLKLGVYLSPRDDKHNVEGGGRAKDPAKQEAYQRQFRTQLTELLTRYGPIHEVWFDGSLVFDVSGIVKKNAPHAVVFQGPQATIRWVGNEEGFAPYPCWNGAKYDPKTWGTLTAAEGDPNGDRWLPTEADSRMRDTWFWNSKNEATVKPLAQLMEMYEASVGHGAFMLLNNTPDRTGLIPAPDVARAKEFGDEVERRYGLPIVYSSGRGETVEADPSAPVVIDAAVTMEDISQGERIRAYVLEGMVDGEWKELAKGTAIGHKKIDKFAPVRVSKVRIRVTKSIGEPLIRRLAIFHTETN